MIPGPAALAALAIAAVSFLLVGIVRRYALARGVLDIPGPRSSHREPTPRGGGAGLLGASLLGFVVVTVQNGFASRLLPALAAVLLVAGIGWADDRRTVPAGSRAVVHVLAGLLVAWSALQGETGLPAALLALACVVATVAAINVVNFMDGIDGLIGVQAVVFGAHLLIVGVGQPPAYNVGLTLMAGALGFLVWNWPPARIFLGDVGSGGLAVFALIGGLLAWRESAWPFIPVFLPLFPLFLDAAVTLVRRAARGERLSTPHRSHLYQRLANDRGWGHAAVSLMYGALGAIGSAVAVLTPGEVRYGTFAAYLAGVLLLGWALDRAAPFAQPQ